MKILRLVTSKITVLAFLLLVNTKSAFAASGVVTFTLPSAPTGIPTLSGTMLILLSLLLFVVALRTASQKKHNINKLFVALLGTGFLVTAGSGAKLVADANAGIATPGIDFGGSNAIDYPIPEDSSIILSNDGSQTISFTIVAKNGSVCYFSIDQGMDSNPTVNQDGSLPNGSIINITCESENVNIQEGQNIQDDQIVF